MKSKILNNALRVAGFLPATKNGVATDWIRKPKQPIGLLGKTVIERYHQMERHPLIGMLVPDRRGFEVHVFGVENMNPMVHRAFRRMGKVLHRKVVAQLETVDSKVEHFLWEEEDEVVAAAESKC